MSAITCISPCLSCSESNFHSCLACDSSSILNDTICLPDIEQYWYIQIITACMIIFFVLPLIARKRSVVLVKLLDFVQIISYFKLINGYTGGRFIWVFLGMRSWGTWSEGWNFFSGDQLVPLWSIEQGHIDKIIRILCTWVTILIIYLLFGVFKLCLEDKPPHYSTYLLKNITQYVWICFYITVQDMAFILACIIDTAYEFSTVYSIASFSIGIFLGFFIVIMLYWGFYLINFIPNDGDKYHHMVHMFLFSYDYDMFPTYQLLDLSKRKQIYRYSNIRLLTIMFKVAYAFLIVGWMRVKSNQMNFTDQIFSIAGFLFMFELAWLIAMPINIKKEYINFIILIIGQIYLFTMLFLPWYWQQTIGLIIIGMVVFWLMIATIIVEGCLNIYKILPVDMYQTGMKIVIQDQKLLYELEKRKKQLEQQNKRLKELEKQVGKKRQNKWLKKSQNVIQDSEKSLPNYQNEQLVTNNKKNLKENCETSSMGSEQIADLYKIDEQKKRKVYQWDKKSKFIYSNTMDA